MNRLNSYKLRYTTLKHYYKISISTKNIIHSIIITEKYVKKVPHMVPLSNHYYNVRRIKQLVKVMASMTSNDIKQQLRNYVDKYPL
jgi:hypothetical protein